MFNVYDIISDIDIASGETKRINCPNCGGYKTFTVTNNMGSLMWNCYKASCNVKGTQKVHMSVDDIRASIHKREAAKAVFELPPYIVPSSDFYYVKKFTDMWGLDFKEHGLMYDVKEDRVVFPIYDNGKIVDATGRAVLKRLPKWKRYGKSDLPYSYGCGNTAVVVEDCVSAVAVSSFGNFVGVAVLGTSLSPSHKKFLTQFSTAIIALDPDAMKKTLAFAKELRGHVNDVRVAKITDDLKYRCEDDIKTLTDLGV